MKPARYILMLLIAFALAVMSGCATVTKGSSQSITVDTLPPAAQCTLTRSGENLGSIDPTPGSISVKKSDEIIEVRCQKEGYQSTTVVLSPEFEDMTVGNILLGGLIGLAIDASGGAMRRYPSSVTLTFIPESFASVEERDAFFDRLQSDFLENYDKNQETIRSQCEESRCESQLKVAEAAKRAKLKEIAQQRENATIGDVAKISRATPPEPATPRVEHKPIKTTAGPLSCGSSRYCGTYEGEIVFSSGGRNIERPFVGRVDRNELMTAIPQDTTTSCQMEPSPLRVTNDGSFESRFEGKCEIRGIGACSVTGKVSGDTEPVWGTGVREQWSKGNIIFQCPEKTTVVGFRSQSLENSGVAKEIASLKGTPLQEVPAGPFAIAIMQHAASLFGESAQ